MGNQKTILITGATSGIGRIAAIKLAHAGHSVLVHGRDEAKARSVQDEILRQNPEAAVAVFLADLSTRSGIQSLADQVKAQYAQLDVLLNNAGGVMGKKRRTSPEGWESTIALNVLAPYMLSALLYPELLRSNNAQIINTASMAHRMAKPNLDDLMYQHKYNPMQAYSDAKLYVILFGRELARRQVTGLIPEVKINALHPGVVATGFAQQSDSFYNWFFKLFRPFLLSPEKGADTLVYLANQSATELPNGKYFVKRKAAPVRLPTNHEQLQRELWEQCAELTGVGFVGNEAD